MGCWNCRGQSGSELYIQTLIRDSPGVLVLAEHWLWPYELDKLNRISDEYVGYGSADTRLTDESSGGRCGGVGANHLESLWCLKLRPTEYVRSA